MSVVLNLLSTYKEDHYGKKLGSADQLGIAEHGPDPLDPTAALPLPKVGYGLVLRPNPDQSRTSTPGSQVTSLCPYLRRSASAGSLYAINKKKKGKKTTRSVASVNAYARFDVYSPHHTETSGDSLTRLSFYYLEGKRGMRRDQPQQQVQVWPGLRFRPTCPETLSRLDAISSLDSFRSLGYLLHPRASCCKWPQPACSLSTKKSKIPSSRSTTPLQLLLA